MLVCTVLNYTVRSNRRENDEKKDTPIKRINRREMVDINYILTQQEQIDLNVDVPNFP